MKPTQILELSRTKCCKLILFVALIRDIITSSADDSVCTILCTIENINNNNNAPFAFLEFLAEKGKDVLVMIFSRNKR